MQTSIFHTTLYFHFHLGLTSLFRSKSFAIHHFPHSLLSFLCFYHLIFCYNLSQRVDTFDKSCNWLSSKIASVSADSSHIDASPLAPQINVFPSFNVDISHAHSLENMIGKAHLIWQALENSVIEGTLISNPTDSDATSSLKRKISSISASQGNSSLDLEDSVSAKRIVSIRTEIQDSATVACNSSASSSSSSSSLNPPLLISTATVHPSSTDRAAASNAATAFQATSLDRSFWSWDLLRHSTRIGASALELIKTEGKFGPYRDINRSLLFCDVFHSPFIIPNKALMNIPNK